jgi:hypothetical protein
VGDLQQRRRFRQAEHLPPAEATEEALVRFEVDPTSSTGYRLVPEDGQGQSSPAQVPAVGDLRGGVDVDGRTYIEVWGGAAWSRVSAVGGSTVVAPQGPTTDTQGFTFTQDAVPTTSRVGDTWFQSSTGLSFVWFDSRWVQFAPGGGAGGGSAAVAPVTASAWLTANLDLPAQAPMTSLSAILFQGSTTSDPNAITYDATTGKFTVHEVGLYQVQFRALHYATGPDPGILTLGKNGYDAEFTLTTAPANANTLGQAWVRIVNESNPFIRQTAVDITRLVRITTPGKELYVKMRHGFPQYTGEPADAHGHGKAQLRSQQSPLGGKATGIEIVRLGA